MESGEAKEGFGINPGPTEESKRSGLGKTSVR